MGECGSLKLGVWLSWGDEYHVPATKDADDLHVNHITVLSVHHRCYAELSRPHHDFQEIAIPELHGWVCHIQLYTRDSLLFNQDWQFIPQDLLIRLRENEMEAIIAIALLSDASMILLQHRI